MARLTVEELERILNSEDDRNITIMPNGEVRDMTPEEIAEYKATKRPLTIRENLGGDY